MENHNKGQKSLFARTFTKEELLAREKYIKIENSEISAEHVDIERAINKAIAKMQEQIKIFSLPQE